ncbi:hypothetical protein SYNPS1DRAFT_26511 [Syncephalis pseudoplumigaleata]|uniref:SMP-30/Gluconolactonase/LRE-like region domain-containing protein n=1 Tax=Syncephalis pseudoplumigaleata TaxID=1712513 RepID=A0A4P9Z5G2_9FUNG|nr:hypothetical protein SYNPS1DRAFT_26511 [Syncephalis pseudoplumigaleata]|eukprot:RKP27853.1 hypothetical protein SYNPS1DRAFT_26511 [Syncephalis pseudoplumigaleata]
MYSGTSISKPLLMAAIVLLAGAVSIGSATPLQEQPGHSTLSRRASLAFAPIPHPSSSSSKLWFGDETQSLAVDKRGNVYGNSCGEKDAKGDYPLNTVGRIDAASNNITLFYEDADSNTYITGLEFFQPRTANNGLLLTDITKHRVIELTWNSTCPKGPASLVGKTDVARRVVCENPEMLQPNDMAVADRGRRIYLSGLRGTMDSGEGDLWLCNTESGKMQRLDVMGRTNGIELSPQEDCLYVSEAVGGWIPSNNRIWRYHLDPATGAVMGDKELFFDFQKYDQTGHVDINGMKLAQDGSLYVTRMSGSEIVVLSPEGKATAHIPTPFKRVADVNMGGPDGKTMYIVGPADSDDHNKPVDACLYKAPSAVAGREWTRLQKEAASK